MSHLFWLVDAQMARLLPFFPKSHGKPRVDDRRVLSGIIFINRNGLRWCDAPIRARFDRSDQAVAFAATFGDGCTMICAVTAEGRSA